MKKYGQEVYDYISSHVEGTPFSELAEMVNKEFETQFSLTSVRSYCKKHKLRNGLQHKKGLKNKSKIFNDEICEFILSHYIGKGPQAMAEVLNVRFNTNFTKNQIKGFYGRHHLNSGLTGHFEEGNVPANKGKKQSEFMSAEGIERTKVTRFKKNNVPHNHVPVGTEVIATNGYIKVKIAEPNVWKFKHRLVYEQKHGRIPKGYKIRLLDGNPLNCNIENLVAVTNEEHLEIIRQDLSYNNPELSKIGVNIAKLSVIQKKREKE